MESFLSIAPRLYCYKFIITAMRFFCNGKIFNLILCFSICFFCLSFLLVSFSKFLV